MSRNLNCMCLCHGSDGNRIGDTMFSCKNCYAANHMGNLPRFGYDQDQPKKARKPVRKPKVVKGPAPVEVKANANNA